MRKKVDLVNEVAATVPSADDVFDAIHAVMHLHRAQQQRAQRDGAHPLTPMDGKVLGFFARQPGATQKDLAEHSGRDKGQLARLITGLKEQGLLEGHADEADRRSIRLQLTADGRAAQQAVQRQRRRSAERAAASLSPDERQQLVALLRKVQAGLAEP